MIEIPEKLKSGDMVDLIIARQAIGRLPVFSMLRVGANHSCYL